MFEKNMTDAWKNQALEYFRGCGEGTEFIVAARRRSRHPGKPKTVISSINPRFVDFQNTIFGIVAIMVTVV